VVARPRMRRASRSQKNGSRGCCRGCRPLRSTGLAARALARRSAGWNIGQLHHRMRSRDEAFLSQQRARGHTGPLRRSDESGIRERRAVDEQMVVARFDHVAGRRRCVLRRRMPSAASRTPLTVAALRVAPLGEMHGGEGHLEVVGELVDPNEFAGQDARDHRTGGHVVPVATADLSGNTIAAARASGPQPLAPEPTNIPAKRGFHGTSFRCDPRPRSLLLQNDAALLRCGVGAVEKCGRATEPA